MEVPSLFEQTPVDFGTWIHGEVKAVLEHGLDVSTMLSADPKRVFQGWAPTASLPELSAR
jgi:hypothetical protein